MGIPAPFEHRVARLRADMAGSGATLFLADHAEMFAWLNGNAVSETLYRACLVPAEGAPWIVLRSLDAPTCRAITWIDDVIAYPDNADPVAVVAASIAQRGFAAARIGVDANSYGFTAARRDRFADLLPRAHWLPMNGISDRLRAIKDASEVTLLRQAAAIADKAMAALVETVGAGTTPRQAAATAAAAYLTHGADDGQVGRITRGNDAAGFLHAELNDTPLGPGDVLHAELVPRVRHYSARMMRPIAVDTPSAETSDIVATLIRLQDAQFAAMRPGVPAAEVDAVLRDAVLAAGLRETYDNVTGYTLGLYCRTPRASDFSHVFLPTSDWPLQADMVFHMYASARGLAISDTVLVTEGGAERLTRTPRQMLGGGR